MPELPLAGLNKTVVACHTGPGKGLTDISQEPDPPTDDVYFDRGVKKREREGNKLWNEREGGGREREREGEREERYQWQKKYNVCVVVYEMLKQHLV